MADWYLPSSLFNVQLLHIVPAKVASNQFQIARFLQGPLSPSSLPLPQCPSISWLRALVPACYKVTYDSLLRIIIKHTYSELSLSSVYVSFFDNTLVFHPGSRAW